MQPLDHVVHIAEIFDRLGIQWVLGGSLASSLRGEPRSTNDADIAISLAASRVPDLINEVEETYYAPLEALIDAARNSSSFNLLHLATGFKVDLFFLGESILDRLQLERRESLRPPGVERSLWITSTPDIILRKLWWYQLGGEVSDRQWNDVLQVLRIQSPNLDKASLSEDASSSGLLQLLDRALKEAT